jgi:hypothetical protein
LGYKSIKILNRSAIHIKFIICAWYSTFRESAGRFQNLPKLRRVEKLNRDFPYGFLPTSEIAQYEDIYRLCFLRGPEGIIIELAQQLK